MPVGPVEGNQLPYARQSHPLARALGSFWMGWVLRQYAEIVTVLPVIDQHTAGATHTAAWDPIRQQSTNFSDGSFGVGWQAPDPKTGLARLGYMAPVPLYAGVVDKPTSSQKEDYGLVNYEGPLLFYQPTSVTLKKGDVIVRPDGTRAVVADHLAPSQVWGETVVWAVTLEQRRSADIVYSIPTV